MKFNFAKSCAVMLVELGATPCEWHTPKFALDTIAGRMTVTPYGDWAACRFDDEKLAVKTIFFGNLNPFSGKWNWHFDKPGYQAIETLKEAFKRIIQKETQ